MTDKEISDFNEANKTIHKVEDQWHYERMIKFGFVPIDLTGVGFVRSYKYEHPQTKQRITVTTGFHGDYWTDTGEGTGHGYHASLELYLEKLKKEGEVNEVFSDTTR